MMIWERKKKTGKKLRQPLKGQSSSVNMMELDDESTKHNLSWCLRLRKQNARVGFHKHMRQKRKQDAHE